MLRKWEYTAKALENLKAPKRVINAAQEVDNILVDLGLDYNTSYWISYVSKRKFQDEDLSSLNFIIGNVTFCSACTDTDGDDVDCSDCKLSGGDVDCTPRYLYADDYYGIVARYMNKVLPFFTINRGRI
jgi:hypothetical protein